MTTAGNVPQALPFRRNDGLRHSATQTSNPSSSWASTHCHGRTTRCTVRCPTGCMTFMDLNNAKSLQFAFSAQRCERSPQRLPKPLPHGGTPARLQTNTSSPQNVRLTKQNGMLVPEAIAPSYKKSKLSTSSLQVPVVFTIGRSDMFHLSLGVTAGCA